MAHVASNPLSSQVDNKSTTMDPVVASSRRTFTPESLASARQSVEDDISHHLRRAQDLKCHLNTLTYISVLPSELLREVFLHLAGIRGCGHLRPAYWRKRHPYRWIHVTHVCKQWREVALRCPTLWSHIAATTKVELVTAGLERSGALPLFVVLGQKPRRTARSSWEGPTSAWRSNIPTGMDTQITGKLVLSQMQRIRTLWLSADPSHKVSLLKMLNAPAPLLESLLIIGNHADPASSCLEHDIERLLSRPDHPNLRRLHFQAFTTKWDSVASLPNLTHLTLEHVYIQPDVLLRTLAQTPLLREFILISRPAGADLSDDEDAGAEALTADKLIPLPQLRRLRVECTLSFCCLLLCRTESPSLRNLQVNATSGSFIPSHTSGFLSSLRTKIGTLGKLQTALFDSHYKPYDPRKPRYSDIIMHATRSRMESRASELQHEIKALRSQADCVLRLSLDDADSCMALCQALPLNDIRSLLLADMVEPWQSILGRYTTEVTRLHYKGLDVSPWFYPQFAPTPVGEISHPYICPRLRVLTLHEPRFDVGSSSRRLARPQPTEDNLLDLFISRYEAGAEIERLRLVWPYYLQDAQVTRLQEVIRFVEVHFETEDEDEAPVSGDEAVDSDYSVDDGYVGNF